MKILGKIVILVAIVLNLFIGVFLWNEGFGWFNEYVPALNKKENISESKMVPYLSTKHGVSFLYPNVWKISASIEDKTKDPSILEILKSQDISDGFLEGVYVYSWDSSEMKFIDLVDGSRNFLLQNGFVVDSEKDILVGGKKAVEIRGTGVIMSDDKTVDYPSHSVFVLVDTGKKVFEFDFSDQTKSFDITSVKFNEMIKSVEFK